MYAGNVMICAAVTEFPRMSHFLSLNARHVACSINSLGIGKEIVHDQIPLSYAYLFHAHHGLCAVGKFGGCRKQTGRGAAGCE